MVDIRTPLSCEEALLRLKSKYSSDGDPAGAFIQIAYDLVKGVYEGQADYESSRYSVKDGTGHKRPMTMPFLQYRLNIAGILAENMNAAADIVLSALLGPAIKLRMIYRTEIRTSMAIQVLDRVENRLQTVSKGTAGVIDKCEEIDLLLFDAAVENVYNDLHRKMHRNHRPQIAYVKLAYRLALEAHRGVYRQSGEPYILHPLAVADILVDSGAESEIVAAGILHDVIEDSEVTKEKVEAISPQIYKYVNAVTSVDKEYEEYRRSKEALQEDFDEQSKEDLDRNTVNKLIECASENESMIYALYIKAADRLHNLRTIDGMQPDKIRNKLNETENYYLPVFRAFGLHEFVNAIEDQVWRVSNLKTGYYDEVSGVYSKILTENSAAIMSTYGYLKKLADEEINKYYKTFSIQPLCAGITARKYYPYQLFKRLNELPPNQRTRSISKRSTPLCYFDIVVEESNGNDVLLFSKLFLKAFHEKDTEAELSWVISDFAIEPISSSQPEKKRFKLVIEDSFYSSYVIYFYNQEDYFIYNNGSLKGVYIPEREAADALDELEGIIKVNCPDGKVVELPKGSTALDFAFKIHKEIGMYALGASINCSKPSEKQLFAILDDGNKVEIAYDAEKAESYGGKKCEKAFVRIEWLNHVKTNLARRQITKWLQDKYECST